MLEHLVRPIIVAPMAGGPSTPALVVAAAQAGSVGFLATGYRTPEQVSVELDHLRATRLPYGLNIFVPQPPVADVAAVEAYRQRLRGEAERLGVDLPPVRPADDDCYAAKVEIALAYAPPLVSFAFGVPDPEVIGALRARGSAVLVTVTDVGEARRAVAAGADALIAQGGAAGGHASTTDPAGYEGTRGTPGLVRDVVAATGRPVIAAGGVGTATDVRELLDAGAVAVQAGTMFLLAAEAGTRPAQRTAMTSGDYTETVVTLAFTGRPARALRNRFTDTYSAAAPLAYPAVHHLTAPLRVAAASQGDAGGLNLWAGTAHAHARPGTTRQILDSLTP